MPPGQTILVEIVLTAKSSFWCIKIRRKQWNFILIFSESLFFIFIHYSLSSIHKNQQLFHLFCPFSYCSSHAAALCAKLNIKVNFRDLKFYNFCTSCNVSAIFSNTRGTPMNLQVEVKIGSATEVAFVWLVYCLD